MRLVALLLLCCSCSTLSNDDLDRLAEHQRNAGLYYDTGKLNQAMGQVERGLEIDPDDYRLNAMKGAILMRASSNNAALLDQALEQLERVYDWRSPMRHEPSVLFYLGLARQKIGLRHSGEAIRLAGRADRALEDQAELRQQSEQERARAEEFLTAADRVLSYLIERGELKRITHNHLLQIRYQLRQDERFEQSVKAFLEESNKALEIAEAEIARTESALYENSQLAGRAQVLKEMIDVRALYSSWLFERKRYEEALVQVDLVLDRDPKRSYDYYNRGRILLELQRQAEAQRDFRLFLSTTDLPQDNDKVTFAVRTLQQ